MNGFRDTSEDELKAHLAALGIDYDPETGNGYDIGGELVWTNGNWNNAINPSQTVYKIPPSPKPSYSQFLLIGLGVVAVLYFLKGKRR